MRRFREDTKKSLLRTTLLLLGSLIVLSSGSSRAALPSWVDIAYDLQAPTIKHPREFPPGHHWKTAHSGSLSFGWRDKTVWVRMNFLTCPNSTSSQLLEIDYPPLSSIEFWQNLPDGKTSYFHTGQDQAFSSRPIPSSTYVFPLLCDARFPVFLKVSSTSSLQIPLRFIDESSFDQIKETRTALYCLYIGSMISLILYNFFLLLSTRSYSHLYYVLYSTSILLFLSGQFGLGFQFIWPNAPALNDYLLVCSLAGSVLFGLLFCASFLRIQAVIPEFRWAFWLLLAAVGLCLIAILFTPSRHLLTLITPFVILFVVVSAIVAQRRGLVEARLFLYGWLVFLAGSVLYALQKIGILPINHLTENAIVYGSIGEALLLSFSLAHRFNIMSKSLALTKNTLQRYLPLDVVVEIMQGRRQLDDKAQELDATILFADLCGFTQATEQLGSEKISEVLNIFFDAMTQVVFQHGGMIDKFIGDGIMIVFGAPQKTSRQTQVLDAMACALAMHETLGQWNDSWEKKFGIRFAMRIGMNSGPVLFGSFGGSLRSEFTVIGATVNLAARVESRAEPDSIYVTEALLEHLRSHPFELAGQFALKGISKRIPLYRYYTRKTKSIAS